MGLKLASPITKYDINIWGFRVGYHSGMLGAGCRGVRMGTRGVSVRCQRWGVIVECLGCRGAVSGLEGGCRISVFLL